MSSAEYNFEMASGTTKVLRNTITDRNGAAVDLSGASIEFNLAKRENDAALLTLSIGSGVTITDAVNGQHDVELAPIDTAALVGSYYWQIEVTDSAGNVGISNRGTVHIYNRFD